MRKYKICDDWTWKFLGDFDEKFTNQLDEVEVAAVVGSSRKTEVENLPKNLISLFSRRTIKKSSKNQKLM